MTPETNAPAILADLVAKADLPGAPNAGMAGCIRGHLARLGTPVRRVSALSLPMLLRVMNYAEQGLDQLPATAAAGTCATPSW